MDDASLTAKRCGDWRLKNVKTKLCYAHRAMETSLLKSEIVRAVQDLPDDSTIEDVMERLYLLAKIERGIEQSESETISQEEIKARFLTARHKAEGVR